VWSLGLRVQVASMAKMQSGSGWSGAEWHGVLRDLVECGARCVVIEVCQCSSHARTRAVTLRHKVAPQVKGGNHGSLEHPSKRPGHLGCRVYDQGCRG